MRIKVFSILFILFALTVATMAYDNDGRDASGKGLLKGGPHRTINSLATEKWIKEIKDNDKIFKRYKFDYPFSLKGPAVLAGGLEYPTYGDRSGDTKWWLAEGGFTADEPELYASFRHFFDPKALSGVHYLTDHLNELEYVYKAVIFQLTGPIGLLMSGDVNPEVNARDWALTGDKNKGSGENEYCLNKGVEYMKAAFAETDSVKKDRLFAQAWRACGETMHLMADMTAIPHVRNDSHPGKAIGFWKIGNTDPNKGYLKNDPYELYTNEEVIKEMKDKKLDPVAKSAVDSASDPKDLFNKLATYTQENFFTAETIGGTYIKNKGKSNEVTITVKPANGKKTYPLPKLADCEYDQTNGFFFRTINGEKILMCAEEWMSSIGWAEPTVGGPIVSRACAKSQASVLIPAALYANAKLVEWFIPKMDLRIDSYYNEGKRLSGRLDHQISVVHKDKLVYKPSNKQYYQLAINNMPQKNIEKLFTFFDDGHFFIDMSKFSLKEKDRVSVGLGIGGIVIQSEDFVVGEEPKPDKAHWIFDRIEYNGKEEVIDNTVTNTKATAKLNDGGGSTTYYESNDKYPKFTYTSNWNYSFTSPPKILIPDDELEITMSVNPVKTEYTGETWRKDFTGSIEYYAVTTSKVGSYYHQVHGHNNVGGRVEEGNNDFPASDTKTSKFTIPQCYQNNIELAISFSVHGSTDRAIIYRYRWSEIFPEVIDTGGCVLPGTLVSMGDGTFKHIENIAINDKIRAFDEASGIDCLADVEKLLIHSDGPFAIDRLIFGKNDTLDLTGNHPILTKDRGWQPVSALVPGDTVYVTDKETGKLKNTTIVSIIRNQSSVDTVYNLKTTKGNYFANDMLVHNKCVMAGSLIETPNGLVKIESLRHGDMVFGSVDNKRTAVRVENIYKKDTILKQIPGKRISPNAAVTANHLILLDGRYISAAETKFPDEEISGSVYDIQTASGNYYIGDVLMKCGN